MAGLLANYRAAAIDVQATYSTVNNTGFAVAGKQYRTQGSGTYVAIDPKIGLKLFRNKAEFRALATPDGRAGRLTGRMADVGSIRRDAIRQVDQGVRSGARLAVR